MIFDRLFGKSKEEKPGEEENLGAFQSKVRTNGYGWATFWGPKKQRKNEGRTII